VTKGLESFNLDMNSEKIDFNNDKGLSDSAFDDYMNQCGYKDSGIEWMGYINIKKSIDRTLNYIDFFNGFAFSDKDYSTVGINVIKMSNMKNGKINYNKNNIKAKIDNKYNQYLLSENDFILGLSGSINSNAVVSKNILPCYLNQRLCKVITNDLNNKKYIRYYFKSNIYKEQVIIDAQGTAILNLSTEKMKKYKIIDFSLNEQNQIANFLDQKTSQFRTKVLKIDKEIEYLKEYRKVVINDVVTGKIKVIK
jgi:type I restriction enzyme S subunit